MKGFWVFLALALAVPALARAQDAGGADGGLAAPDGGSGAVDGGAVPSQGGGPDGGPVLEPPKPLTDTAVPYPAGAPPITRPLVVRVKILVGADGVVQKVELITHTEAVFDDAVVLAAQQFLFKPARWGGKPVPVEIAYSHTFLPPPPPTPPPGPGPAGTTEGPARGSVLRGRLVEMGTGAAVAGGNVVAHIGDRHYATDADATGHFRLPVPPGEAKITVVASGYSAFRQKETIGAHQEVVVTYYVERERFDRYESVVYGEQRREEVSRVTLRGPEITQVPGTFGDPFRVIQTLPGVSSVISLLPFPVVRGTSPSSTGFLLDGTRVPLLYHMLSGPSVIHPEFIDEVEFYPGGAPVLYGGYTGGIVDGRTRRARSDEHLIDVDANLLLAGGMVREPVPFLGATATVAGRYGYPGLILSLATNQASLSYWDYQLRLDGGNARNGWTVFAYGARDELDTVSPTADPNDPNPPLTPSLILGFHRLDMRYYRGAGKLDGTYRLVLGYDSTVSAGSTVSMVVVEPSLRWHYKQSDSLSFAAGVEGSFHDTHPGAAQTGGDVTLTSITKDLKTLYTASELAEALWRPTSRWLIRPGVRVNLLDDTHTQKVAADPRLTVRYKLLHRDLAEVASQSEESNVWLKAGIGIYHQPPRFVVPLPGLDTMPLKYGLLRSIQTSVGAEIPLQNRFTVTGEAFYSDMDPTIFDLTVNQQDVNKAANMSLLPTSTVPPADRGQQVLDRLLAPQQGRSYGAELLIRRQARNGIYGWLSYTLSRAERKKDGAWVPYDFDRTHLLNLVAGLPLKRNWDIGLRFQYQSGKPATTTGGYNAARGAGYTRIDFRIDKRAVWRSWLLDFYVDVLNAALLPEELTPGATIRYVLPTVGVRGRF